MLNWKKWLYYVLGFIVMPYRIVCNDEWLFMIMFMGTTSIIKRKSLVFAR